jgi:hypothetical protein
MSNVQSFPHVRLASFSGGSPVEVSLIAQLGIGAGNKLIAETGQRQRQHSQFLDALDEPSVKLSGVDLAHADAASLYSFIVGKKGHPFHRHAGRRMFTAISGSAGARLRFSTASDAQMQHDPEQFMLALREVTIPPDCLFTVRFGRGTWHQFQTRDAKSRHPALFALSCHPDEMDGIDNRDLLEEIANDQATIPALTEVLPDAVALLLEQSPADTVQTVHLTLTAPAESMAIRSCAAIRGIIGRLRSAWTDWRPQAGFRMIAKANRPTVRATKLAADSLLQGVFSGEAVDHDDLFEVQIDADRFPGIAHLSPRALLSKLLDGFIHHQPQGVSALMQLRNILVRPLGLRRSPLGCPVSSLLSDQAPLQFDARFPVLAIREDTYHTKVEVLLGADDKHLRFRSIVGVQQFEDGRVALRLGTRVQCLNGFGRFYMRAIDHLHRHYITPAMLSAATEHVLMSADDLPTEQFSTGQISTDRIRI